MRAYVQDVLDEVFREKSELFLIDIDVLPNRHIRVTLDSDKGLNLGDCVSVSRKIEKQLEEKGLDFSLEVTSSGAFEPFKQPRQYAKNIGRILEIKTNQYNVEGKLIKIEGTSITLEIHKKIQKPTGKGKISSTEYLEIPVSDIAEARVAIKF